MSVQRLSDETVQSLLDELNVRADAPWHIEEDKLTRTFIFDDFNQAFGFMTRCALHAEKMNHHPEWSNTYHTVHVRLTTHEVSGLSKLDFKLAAEMEGCL